MKNEERYPSAWQLFIIHYSLLCFASVLSRLGIADASIALLSLLQKVIKEKEFFFYYSQVARQSESSTWCLVAP